MGLKCGIIGLPNVGKSTLFNVLTSSAIDVANYPFCTIDPNVGVVSVPDQRLCALADIVSPQQVIPTMIEFVDIAGLVKGASKGEGLGNQFLAHIRETNAIVQVVRCFDDDNIIHVAGRVDPLSDIETINTELCLVDMASLDRALHKVMKVAKSGDKIALRQQQLFIKAIEHLDQGLAIRSLILSAQELSDIYPLHLLTQKPMFYIANVEDGGLDSNLWLEKLKLFSAQEGTEEIPVCMALESELAELDDESQRELLHEIGFEEPGLNRVIRASYRLLGLHTYFTAGVKEVRAWILRKGDTAQHAAGVIHKDFERGFIQAEVIAYEDFIKYQGKQGAKDAGKWRLEGKEYIVSDGDVMHFRFNV